jgi:hypothetical protein
LRPFGSVRDGALKHLRTREQAQNPLAMAGNQIDDLSYIVITPKYQPPPESFLVGWVGVASSSASCQARKGLTNEEFPRRRADAKTRLN